MSTRKSDSGEYEFTRAAYDELSDARVRLAASFECCIRPTPQRGVWTLEVSAVSIHPGEEAVRLVRYSATWPNSTAVSFGAFLYQCAHRAVRMVEMRRMDEAERAKSRHDRG